MLRMTKITPVTVAMMAVIFTNCSISIVRGPTIAYFFPAADAICPIVVLKRKAFTARVGGGGSVSVAFVLVLVLTCEKINNAEM